MTSTQEAAADQNESPSAPWAFSSIWFLTGTILVAHLAVDLYAATVPALLVLLEVRCNLRPSETAWLLGLGSLSAGLAQPLCAWLSDRYDWRGFGGLGLALATLFICSVGWADRFGSLLPIFLTGMFGVGMFHPIAAASMGALSERRRSSNLSLFFICGMIGGVLGATAMPRLVAWSGSFSVLTFGIVPGLICAGLLHRSIRRVPHRHASHKTVSFQPSEIKARWTIVGLLYASAVLRFAVNLAAVYLYVRWVQSVTAAGHSDWSRLEIASYSAPIIGDFNACTLLGMALGGIASGLFVRQGRERWPLVLCPIAFAPTLFLFPHVSLAWGHLLSVLVGIGFAAMIPVSIALAQQLLPHRTSLASSLMMGGAWAVAMLGPRLAEFGIQHFGIATTFYATGATLGLAGILALPLHGFSRYFFCPPVLDEQKV